MKNLLLICVLLLVSCASGQGQGQGEKFRQGSAVPDWYLGSGYAKEEFLTAQADGSSEREARRNAAGELASLFAARVNFDSTASFHYEENEASNSKSRGVEQTVRVSSKQEIYGIEYTQPYRTGGKVYILAYLDRNKVGKLYAERIEDRRGQIAELRSRARKFNPTDDNTENLLAGFILYDYSVDQALRNQILLEQLQIINKPMHATVLRKIDYNSVKLAEQRSKFARRLPFQVNYEGDEDLLFLGENIAEEMSKLGFVRSGIKRGGIEINIKLALTDVETNNNYANLAWDLQIDFTSKRNADDERNADETGQGSTLVSFAKSGRESSITRSRTLVTLKRMLNEDIEREFMQQLYRQFAKFAGIREG